MTVEQSNFIQTIGAAAVKAYPKYKILPSLTIAQAILESSWGKSGLSKDCFNYFGMKWREGCGCDYKEYQTKEQKSSGAVYWVTARFRKYKNTTDGIAGYYKFLYSYSRYKNLVGITDANKACDLIRQDGWATSLTYAQNLKKLVATYNLTDWDRKAGAISYTPTIRPGDKGEGVKLMQERLISKGYTLKADGIYGAKTKEALTAFQAETGLVVDGICGKKTWEKLIK